MCLQNVLLSECVLFLGCYVSLVHTQWAWNPAGMCLIWKFYPLGLVNSNTRLRTLLQRLEECRNGKSCAQRQQGASAPSSCDACAERDCCPEDLSSAVPLLASFLQQFCALIKGTFGQVCFPFCPWGSSYGSHCYRMHRSSVIQQHGT